jgi:hypothetical protein
VFSTGIFELIQPQKQPPCGVAVFIYDPVVHSRFAWEKPDIRQDRLLLRALCGMIPAQDSDRETAAGVAK